MSNIEQEPVPSAAPSAPPQIPGYWYPTPKVRGPHTKGWAIAWALAFAVMTLIATFWVSAYVVNFNRTHCAVEYNGTGSFNVCVNQNTGEASVNQLSGS